MHGGLVKSPSEYLGVEVPTNLPLSTYRASALGSLFVLAEIIIAVIV